MTAPLQPDLLRPGTAAGLAGRGWDVAIGAVPGVRRLIDEPFTHEEVVVLVDPVVLVNLQPSARDCQAVAALGETNQTLRVLPHPEGLAKES